MQTLSINLLYPYLMIFTTGKKTCENMGRSIEKSGDTVSRALPEAIDSLAAAKNAGSYDDNIVADLKKKLDQKATAIKTTTGKYAEVIYAEKLLHATALAEYTAVAKAQELALTQKVTQIKPTIIETAIKTALETIQPIFEQLQKEIQTIGAKPSDEPKVDKNNAIELFANALNRIIKET